MPTTLLLDKEEMTRILERLACEVLERHGQCERVMLVLLCDKALPDRDRAAVWRTASGG